MEERLLFCVAGCSASKCSEIFRGRTSECRWCQPCYTLLVWVTCGAQGAYFSVAVKIISFSSHLHVLYMPSAVGDPLVCVYILACTWVSSPSLACLAAGHKSKCPGFSGKFWSEWQNNWLCRSTVVTAVQISQSKYGFMLNSLTLQIYFSLLIISTFVQRPPSWCILPSNIFQNNFSYFRTWTLCLRSWPRNIFLQLFWCLLCFALFSGLAHCFRFGSNQIKNSQTMIKNIGNKIEEVMPFQHFKELFASESTHILKNFIFVGRWRGEAAG